MPITYQIISCALSPLEVDGFPFAIILGTTDGDGLTCLQGFVLHGWRELPELFPNAGHETLGLFIAEVKAMCGLWSEDNGRFLESLADLSIGPVRSFAVGICERASLAEVLNSKLIGVRPALYWPTSFADLCP